MAVLSYTDTRQELSSYLFGPVVTYVKIHKYRCTGLFSGYVDAMAKLLFTLPKSEMKKVLNKYTAMVLEPLDRQLTERESIKR